MVNILIAGDFCPITETSFDFNQQNEKFFFSEDFLKLIKSADLAIANLECPLTDSNKPISKTGPNLKARPSAVNLLKSAGINLVTLANNHIMDYGAEGLRATKDILKESGIAYVGGGESLEDAQRAYFKEVNEVKIAIISIAENEFSTTHGNYPGVNPLNLPSNFLSIKDAKRASDVVLVLYHGGNEEYNLPSPRLKETLRFFVEAGADAVAVHHSHRFSGYEVFKNKPIFYGLGNFLFDQKDQGGIDWQKAIVVMLSYQKDNVSFQIYPILQSDFGGIAAYLLKNDEKIKVLSEIEILNAIIADDVVLKKYFMSFVEKKRKQYKHFIEPHSVRLLHGLMSLGLIPSLLSKKKRMLYLNLIRCESHRDILLEILKK